MKLCYDQNIMYRSVYSRLKSRLRLPRYNWTISFLETTDGDHMKVSNSMHEAVAETIQYGLTTKIRRIMHCFYSIDKYIEYFICMMASYNYSPRYLPYRPDFSSIALCNQMIVPELLSADVITTVPRLYFECLRISGIPYKVSDICCFKDWYTSSGTGEDEFDIEYIPDLESDNVLQCIENICEVDHWRLPLEDKIIEVRNAISRKYPKLHNQFLECMSKVDPYDEAHIRWCEVYVK